MKRINNIKRSTVTYFRAHVKNTMLNHFHPQIDWNVYNPISVCVTASSTIRHNFNALVGKIKSGKIAKDEFIYRTSSIYKALNLIDNNLDRTIKSLERSKKEN